MERTIWTEDLLFYSQEPGFPSKDISEDTAQLFQTTLAGTRATHEYPSMFATEFWIARQAMDRKHIHIEHNEQNYTAFIGGMLAAQVIDIEMTDRIPQIHVTALNPHLHLSHTKSVHADLANKFTELPMSLPNTFWAIISSAPHLSTNQEEFSRQMGAVLYLGTLPQGLLLSRGDETLPPVGTYYQSMIHKASD